MSNKFETIPKSKQQFSLIKYEPPIDITQKLQAYHKAKQAEPQNDYKPSPQDILNIILPPKQWKNQHQRYFMQYVSHQKSQRQDIQQLKSKLQTTLLAMQARTEGLCPIRQFLFSQLFDEIIRQTTLDCTQRGLMLVRLRDQRKMTISSYQTLYLQANRYGMKQQYESQQGTQQLQNELQIMQHKNKQLKIKKQILQSKKKSMQLKIIQRKGIQNQKQQYQINCLTKQNQFLATFLEGKRKNIQVVQNLVEEQEQQKVIMK